MSKLVITLMVVVIMIVSAPQATAGGGCCSNCCFGNGTFGCDDDACEITVCISDQFCCGNTWDSLCAELAILLCPVCANLEGHCCVAHGLGETACDDPECQAIMCRFDPFCCSQQWDELCAIEAQALCAVCRGDCCDDNTTPGCSDAACESAVCALAPVCCAVAWVNECADVAAALCPALCGEPPDCPWDCDASDDGIVGIPDVVTLIAQFDVQSPLNCTGGTCDFNGNGCVDVLDLLTLLAHYDPTGMGCPQ